MYIYTTKGSATIIIIKDIHHSLVAREQMVGYCIFVTNKINTEVVKSAWMVIFYNLNINIKGVILSSDKWTSHFYKLCDIPLVLLLNIPHNYNKNLQENNWISAAKLSGYINCNKLIS